MNLLGNTFDLRIGGENEGLIRGEKEQHPWQEERWARDLCSV